MLEYLGQLLGSTTDDKVIKLVDNIGKVQRGETIIISDTIAATSQSPAAVEQQQTKLTAPSEITSGGKKPKPPPVASPSQKSKQQAVSAAAVRGNGNNNQYKKKPPAAANSATAVASAKKDTTATTKQAPKNASAEKTEPYANNKIVFHNEPPTPSEQNNLYNAAKIAVAGSRSQPSFNNNNNYDSENNNKTKQKDSNRIKKAPPITGKAPYECGCFGMKHKALANCLYCGRISCEKEGYNFCPFCGHFVELVQPPTTDDDDE